MQHPLEQHYRDQLAPAYSFATAELCNAEAHLDHHKPSTLRDALAASSITILSLTNNNDGSIDAKLSLYRLNPPPPP